MIGERFGHLFDIPLRRLAVRIPFSPNAITLAGLLVTIYASFVLSRDLRFGGLLVLGGSICDILDGVVARSNGKESRFGAFLDSLLDRYADAFILSGIAVNRYHYSDLTGMMLCAAALVGAFMVSYARARAEGLGVECKTGIMERPERIVVVVIGTLTGAITPALIILAVFTNVTVVQRVHRVWKATQTTQ